jgi:hypothetical protein
VLITRYYSGDQIEKNEMGGAYGHTGERGGVYRVLVNKHQRKRQLGRSRSRCEDNI